MTVDPATAVASAPPADIPPRRGLVGLLVFDGALCAVLSVFYLGLYIGGTPFPITLLLSGIVNVLLVMAVRAETRSLRTATLPLVAWAVGLFFCLLGGPGGDQLLLSDWRTLMLPITALAPPAAYLFAARFKELARAARQPAPHP